MVELSPHVGKHMKLKMVVHGGNLAVPLQIWNKAYYVWKLTRKPNLMLLWGHLGLHGMGCGTESSEEASLKTMWRQLTQMELLFMEFEGGCPIPSHLCHIPSHSSGSFEPSEDPLQRWGSWGKIGEVSFHQPHHACISLDPTKYPFSVGHHTSALNKRKMGETVPSGQTSCNLWQHFPDSMWAGCMCAGWLWVQPELQLHWLPNCMRTYA